MLLERLPRFARVALAWLLLVPAVALAPPATRGWAVAAIATGAVTLVVLTVTPRVRSWAARTSSAETPRREFLVPIQVPPPPRLLVGREAELAEIIRHLRRDDADRPRLVVISGPAGIGKSSLALRAAHQALPWFPRGGALYAALGRHPYQRQIIDRVLASFVDALQGPQQTVPEDPAECRRVYRELSARRAPLVVLDDVADARTVRELLPAGRGSAVLVTSREPLPELGEHTAIALAPLPESAARELLTAILGERAESEPAAVAAIVESAGGHPMALQLASASLAARRHWALDAAVGRVGGLTGARQRPFSGALDISYALLPEQERAALRWLGALPDQTFAPWMLAALLADEEEAAWHLIERLSYARLLERQVQDSAGVARFRVPDHVYAYAAERLHAETSAQERAAALRRLDQARAQRQDTQAQDIVRRAGHQAYDLGQLSGALNAVRGALALARENHAAAEQAVTEPGLSDAERAAHERRLRRTEADEAIALAALAELHAELGGVEDAWELAINALVRNEKTSRPRALRCLGRLQRRLRRLADAETTLADAERAARDIRDSSEQIRVVRELAVALAMGERPDAGVAAAHRALRLCADRPDQGRRLRPSVLWALGFALTRCREFEAAEQVLVEADALAEESGQRLWVGWIGQQRAAVAYRDRRYDYGRDLAFRAMETFTEMRHRYGTAHCRLVAGLTYLAQRSPAEARKVLEEALHTFNACGDRWVEARTAMALAEALTQLDRAGEARKLLRRAVEIFDDLGAEREWARARGRLTELDGLRRRWSVRPRRRGRTVPHAAIPRRPGPELPAGSGFWWSEPVALPGAGEPAIAYAGGALIGPAPAGSAVPEGSAGPGGPAAEAGPEGTADRGGGA